MTTLAIYTPGIWEILALAAIGLLIFGKRLPEVGRSLGKGIVEFKKGLSGIDEEIDKAGKEAPKIDKRDDPQHEMKANAEETTGGNKPGTHTSA